jgi:hypothetical protein
MTGSDDVRRAEADWVVGAATAPTGTTGALDAAAWSGGADASARPGGRELMSVLSVLAGEASNAASITAGGKPIGSVRIPLGNVAMVPV